MLWGDYFFLATAREDLASKGLLVTTSRARAEGWLEWWTKRVSFEVEAANKALILETGKGEI